MKNESVERAYPCHVPDRTLNAPLLTFDIPRVTEKIKGEATWKKGERNAITLLKSAGRSIVLIALHRQNEIDFNQSGKFVSVQIIEGSIVFTTQDQSVVLKKGCLLTLHESIKHTVIALEESVLLLTIAPDAGADPTNTGELL